MCSCCWSTLAVFQVDTIKTSDRSAFHRQSRTRFVSTRVDQTIIANYNRFSRLHSRAARHTRRSSMSGRMRGAKLRETPARCGDDFTATLPATVTTPDVTLMPTHRTFQGRKASCICAWAVLAGAAALTLSSSCLHAIKCR